MADRITLFSTTFPSYHPRKGEPTHFIEKMWAGLMEIDPFWWGQFLPRYMYGKYRQFEPKYHTVRAGHRYKAKDHMDARIWMDKPYRSKQRAPFESLIEIQKVWDFDINGTDWAIDGRLEYALTGAGFDGAAVAKNDGLSYNDFDDWFTANPQFKKTKEFHGQIISWAKHIEY